VKYAVVGAILAMTGISAQTLHYPEARKGDVIDGYHGTKVADPYRWLEDTDSPETAAWVTAENQVTQAYLSKIPERAGFKERLTRLYDYERFTYFEKAGPRYLFFRNDGLQNQDVLYVSDGLAGTPRVLLDPNTLRADGTAALAGVVADREGKRLAYGIADAGSDWSEWRVRNIETGQDLADRVRWIKFLPVAWAADGSGFYYLRFPEPKSGEALRGANTNSKIYFHRLGEPQSGDRLIFERPDHPEWLWEPHVSDDGRYLFIVVQTNDFAKNLLYYQDLRDPSHHTVELIHELDAAYLPLGTDGNSLYLRTTWQAPKGRVIRIDLAHPERANWHEIVPEQAEAMDAAMMANGRFVLNYLKDASSQMKVFGADGLLKHEVSLPGPGKVAFFPARQQDREAFFAFTSYTAPRTIFRLDLQSDRTAMVRQSKLGFDPAQFVTDKVFYSSKDGTRIPMSLVHRKGIRLDGSNRTVLYGYGGFDVNMLPEFSPWVIAWLESGGVFAVANLRGGGEYGEAWHLAGVKAKKQNVFDDFIAAAEWLIAERYTSNSRLAIFGGSNGGLLIGAVLNQRPELFGAAMPAVGVMDMLRFQKFTIGSAWTGEYGSSDNAADFAVLRAYSPLHNIRVGGRYPAVLITTSDHDDRVVPGHSFKYAATLQAAQAAARPVLIRIETRAGHGGGKPTAKLIDEYADRLAFLTRELQ
jgi:prolyl oligopeptidase